MPSTPSKRLERVAQARCAPRGRSICERSPVTAMRAFSPSRVRNIFICIGVVFCASSRMTKALAKVRPRMKASGAISISPLAKPLHHLLAGQACRGAHRRAGADRDRPSRADRRAGSPGARRPRPPAATGRCARPRPTSCRSTAIGDREIGLAGAGRTQAEDQLMRCEARGYRRPGSGCAARCGACGCGSRRPRSDSLASPGRLCARRSAASTAAPSTSRPRFSRS